MAACIVFCTCSRADVIPRDVVSAVQDGLARCGAPVTVVPDLCEAAARSDEVLREAVAAEQTVVIACFPRAVRWLLAWHGLCPPGKAIEVLNMREEPPQRIVDRVSALVASVDALGAAPAPPDEGWVPWFPVIDRSRCTNCKQCLDFCLFGVFGLSEAGAVEVVNPRGCKDNCPACARICPQAAIVFPKYGEPPINGAEVEDEEAVRDKIKVNMDEILGQDAYAALRERRRLSRRRLLRARNGEQAEAERRACTRNGTRGLPEQSS